MRKLTVILNTSMDGVIQAPARADEDTRGGFAHGGWAAPYFDAVMLQNAAKGMNNPGDMLFGRRTYQDLYSVWPKRTDNPFTPHLNAARKYVVSRALDQPLPWENSVLLRGEASETVAALKQQDGRDLAVIGSGELVQSLLAAQLVDMLQLSVHPLVLGSGQRLFPDHGPLARWRLIESTPTTTGVIIVTYAPA